MPAQLSHSPSPGRPVTEGSLIEARKRLVIALDFPEPRAALDLVNCLGGACLWFKVGMELFTAAGPGIVEQLVARGNSVFLDLKFHDIPNTVAGAVRSAARLGAGMLTIHAGGGPEMLKAARAALEGVEAPPELLAVTVLTSMDGRQLQAVGIDRAPDMQVETLARMGWGAGIRGFVCSPREVSALRKLTGPEGVLVIPGIRPSGAALGDQSRTATPAEAIRQGASFLVVGRPVTRAPDPGSAVKEILEEMAGALGPA
jgi:orotidine-5'-phosphate decarboxylase